MTEAFSPEVNEDNPDPRVACVLLLDTSDSMRFANPGEPVPIDELNKGIVAFKEDILEDPLARKRAEIMVITCGGDVYTDPNFVEAQDFQPPTLTPQGSTPMGRALCTALDVIEQQKQVYKQAGIEYYRPWLVVMTDGAPTDDVTQALSRLSAAQAKKGLVVFPIGIGDAADMGFLGQLSPDRGAVRLKGLTSFSDFFKWLSASMSAVSQSATHGADDAAVEQRAEEVGQVALKPIDGWAQI